jgi:hypothetical protein
VTFCRLVLIYQSYSTSHPLWQQHLQSLPRETSNITNHFELKRQRVLQKTTDFTCGYIWTNFWPKILMLYLRHMEFERAALLLRSRKDPLLLYFWSRLLAEVRGFPQSLQENARILLQTTQPVSSLSLPIHSSSINQTFDAPKIKSCKFSARIGQAAAT